MHVFIYVCVWVCVCNVDIREEFRNMTYEAAEKLRWKTKKNFQSAKAYVNLRSLCDRDIVAAARVGETQDFSAIDVIRKVIQTFNFMPREHVLRVSHISIFSSIARIEGISLFLSLSLSNVYMNSTHSNATIALVHSPLRAFPLRYSRLVRVSLEKQERIGQHYHPHSITSRSRHAIANDFDANTFNSIGSPRSTDCSTAHDFHRPHYYFFFFFILFDAMRVYYIWPPFACSLRYEQKETTK